MLDELQRSVEECRKALAEVERIVTRSQTTIKNSNKMLLSFEKDLRALAQETAKDAAAWLESPIAAELIGIVQEKYKEWLAEQLMNVRTEAGVIERAEKAYHKATLDRSEAQAKVDDIRKRHQLAHQAESAARSAAEQALGAARTAADKKNSAVSRLDGLIAELGSVMTEPEWRSAWDAGPEDFHKNKKTEADLWLGNSREAEQLAAGMGTLQAELQGLTLCT